MNLWLRHCPLDHCPGAVWQGCEPAKHLSFPQANTALCWGYEQKARGNSGGWKSLVLTGHRKWFFRVLVVAVQTGVQGRLCTQTLALTQVSKEPVAAKLHLVLATDV